MAKHNRNRQPVGAVTPSQHEQLVGAVLGEIAKAEARLRPRVPAPPKHKRMTRKQARSWLTPMRRALAEIKAGEVDAIQGYAVTRLHDQDDYARLDFCINGFVGLIRRLMPDQDVSSAEKLSRHLAHGISLTVAQVDAVFALLNVVEDRLVGLPIKAVMDAVTTEQIVIEMEALGLKEAA